MNELIIFIAEKIDKIDEENNKILNSIKEKEEIIKTLSNYVTDITLIRDDAEKLSSLIKTNLDDCALVLQLIFNDDYNKYSTQPQVIESKNKLISKVQESIEEYEKDKKELEKIEINDDEKNKYDHLINLIKNYNSDTYISIDELFDLREVINEFISLNISDERIIDEITKFTMDILINNSKKEVLINETRIEEETLSVEEIEEMDNDRKLINSSTSDEKTESEEKKKYLQNFKDFLKNAELKNNNEDLYNKACIIVKNAIKTIETDETIDYTFIETDIKESYISALDGEYLHIATAKYLLESYANGDIDNVNKIINAYRNASDLETKEFFKLEGYTDYSKLIEKIEKLISGKSYKESFDDFTIDNIMDIIKNADSQTDYKYLLSAVLKGIDLIVKDRKIDDDEKEQLNSLFKEANKIIKENKEEKAKEENSDSQIFDYFRSGFSNLENYVVFYDQEEFINSVQKAITEHAGYKLEIVTNTLDKIDKLVSSDIASLSSERSSHNIHFGPNDPNPYEILALRNGAARVSFKTIENSGIIDPKTGKQRRVIMVLHSLFGDTDADTKSEDELASVKYFENTMESRYGFVKKYRTKRPSETSEDGLYQIFAQDKNKDGITDKALKELKTAKEIIDYLNSLKSTLENTSSEEVVEEKKTTKKGGKKNGSK